MTRAAVTVVIPTHNRAASDAGHARLGARPARRRPRGGRCRRRLVGRDPRRPRRGERRRASAGTGTTSRLACRTRGTRVSPWSTRHGLPSPTTTTFGLPTSSLSSSRRCRSHPEARWSIVSSVVVDKKLRILRHEEAPGGRDARRGSAQEQLRAGGRIRSAGLNRSRARGRRVRSRSSPTWPIGTCGSAWPSPLPRPRCGTRLVAYRVHPGGMAHGVRRTEDEFEVITAKYADDRSRRGISTRPRHVASLPRPAASPKR